MVHFKYSSLINATVEKVWNFHEREDIFELLTSPWQPVKIIRREGGLEIGAISEFRLILGPIPVRWVARHIECQKYSFFVDKQIEGPVNSWVHRHQFVAEHGQMKLTDSIDYQLPGDWLVKLLLGWWVNSRLKDMFRYRHEVTKRFVTGMGKNSW